MPKWGQINEKKKKRKKKKKKRKKKRKKKPCLGDGSKRTIVIM